MAPTPVNQLNRAATRVQAALQFIPDLNSDCYMLFVANIKEELDGVQEAINSAVKVPGLLLSLMRLVRGMEETGDPFNLSEVRADDELIENDPRYKKAYRSVKLNADNLWWLREPFNAQEPSSSQTHDADLDSFRIFENTPSDEETNISTPSHRQRKNNICDTNESDDQTMNINGLSKGSSSPQTYDADPDSSNTFEKPPPHDETHVNPPRTHSVVTERDGNIDVLTCDRCKEEFKTCRWSSRKGSCIRCSSLKIKCATQLFKPISHQNGTMVLDDQDRDALACYMEKFSRDYTNVLEKLEARCPKCDQESTFRNGSSGAVEDTLRTDNLLT